MTDRRSTQSTGTEARISTVRTTNTVCAQKVQTVKQKQDTGHRQTLQSVTVKRLTPSIYSVCHHQAAYLNTSDQ